MKRLFWIGVGAAVGVYGVHRLERAAGDLPESAVRALSTPVKRFADEVREGMVEREGQIREALGLSTPTRADAAPGSPAPDPPPTDQTSRR